MPATRPSIYMFDRREGGNPRRTVATTRRTAANNENDLKESPLSPEFEALENRIRRLESQNRCAKWFGIVGVVLAMTSAAWAQKPGGVVTQAQKFELRDDAGRLRADLSLVNGDPALRFFGEHADAESVLDGYSFTILKRGGTDADIVALFGAHGLSFEDGRDHVFVSLRGDENEQTGKLQLNDYHHKIFAGITPADLPKLRPNEAR